MRHRRRARGAREGKAQAHVSGISRLEPARARGTFSRTRRRRSRDRPAGRGARRTDPARRSVPRRTRPRDGDGRRRLFPRAATPTRASIPVVHGSNVLRSPERAGGGGATCRHGTAGDADHGTREGRATEKNEQKNERRLGHSWRRRRAIRRAPLPGGRRPHRPNRSRSIVCWKTSGKLPETLDALVVVEGINDATAVQRAFRPRRGCRVLKGAYDAAAGHYDVPDAVVADIARMSASGTRVVVLTDSDVAGRQMRGKIVREAPGAYHAFLGTHLSSAKEDTATHRAGNVGVEHASVENLRNAVAGARRAACAGEAPGYRAANLAEKIWNGGVCAGQTLGRRIPGGARSAGSGSAEGWLGSTWASGSATRSSWCGS